jgi:hypothetical protein
LLTLLCRWAHWARCSLAMLTIGPERPAPHPRAFSTVDVTYTRYREVGDK